jgi:hypothetical protein
MNAPPVLPGWFDCPEMDARPQLLTRDYDDGLNLVLLPSDSQHDTETNRQIAHDGLFVLIGF